MRAHYAIYRSLNAAHKVDAGLPRPRIIGFLEGGEACPLGSIRTYLKIASYTLIANSAENETPPFAVAPLIVSFQFA